MIDFDKIILGIDPGTNVLGFGIIGIKKSDISIISSGIVRLNKLPNHELKLKSIFENITNLIEKHLPDEVAI